MITPEGLADQLLGVAVAAEMPALEEARQGLVVAGAEAARQLADIEGRILAVLSGTQGNILEDATAVNVLSEAKRVRARGESTARRGGRGGRGGDAMSAQLRVRCHEAPRPPLPSFMDMGGVPGLHLSPVGLLQTLPSSALGKYLSWFQLLPPTHQHHAYPWRSPQLSDDITSKQAASAATSEALEAARTRYRPLSATAAVLFFAIAALQALDHMYQYSLAWFIGEQPGAGNKVQVTRGISSGV